jgi:hypothetical protein
MAATIEESILRHIPASFIDSMLKQLIDPLSKGELKASLDDMARDRSPGPDGISVDFYRTLRDTLGDAYTEMITSAIQQGRLPNGMTQGLITLLHKGGERELLTNWRPISLLNVSYKILAKSLQKRLQLMLSEVIDEDQSAFLPTRFILDNVLAQHEVIQWVRETKQDLVLLKLDFRKAYDTVHWDFLLAAMKKMGMPDHFINIVKMLLHDATSSVVINGEPTKPFPVQRGVRQGCPLAPYLFLVVAETLNRAAKAAMLL